MSTDRSLIEEEVVKELKESLVGHGLEVENFYLSSLTPIEGWQITDEDLPRIEPVSQMKTAEQIRSERDFSNQRESETNNDSGQRTELN